MAGFNLSLGFPPGARRRGGAGGAPRIFSGEYDWYYDFDFSLGTHGWTGSYANYSSSGGYWTGHFIGSCFELEITSPTCDNSEGAGSVRAVALDIEMGGTIVWYQNVRPHMGVSWGPSIFTASEVGLYDPVYERWTTVREGISGAGLASGHWVRFYTRYDDTPAGWIRLYRIWLAGTGYPPWVSGPQYTP